MNKTMKALELFFNTEDTEAIYETWCFEPEPLREKELGNLYLIAKLKGQNSASLDYLDSDVKEAYSNQGDFEQAIKIAKQKIGQRGLTKLELAALVIKDNKLTFAKTKGAEIVLLRNEVENIGRELKDNLSALATIKLKSRDKVLAVTSEAWRKLRQKHLISKMLPYSDSRSIKSILADSIDTPGAALIVILKSGFLEKTGKAMKQKAKRLQSLMKFFKGNIPSRIRMSGSDLFHREFNPLRLFTRQTTKIPFLIALSYLLSFISIRTLVTLVGSANSEIAQTVKESSHLLQFHIGRNIILFGYHVHHFYFGILLIIIAGWLAITRTSVNKERLAITYGIGLGLLMDEIGLLLTWGDYASSLSYLLGVFLLGVFLNIIYFPAFWKKIRTKVVSLSFPFRLLNKVFDKLIQVADKISQNN